MTQLSYIVMFNDDEMITLNAALSHYMELCERELARGVTVPFWAASKAIKSIRSKLLANVHGAIEAQNDDASEGGGD